ncbi:MAG: hypothetical protein D3910_12875 [Candidatus Electrothrix sp. ATG2]|nr:hypothetical protein [Candidatus Electrothrix sp. ATG2]
MTPFFHLLKLHNNLKQRLFMKYKWLILLNLYLIAPLFFSLGIMRGFESIHDPVVWWNIACSIAFLLSLQHPKESLTADNNPVLQRREPIRNA